MSHEHHDTIVIGAGQAGLSTGYHLTRAGRDFIILDANARVGDSWRNRWDSLRLFTSARYDGLAGMPFPAARDAFPTKDEMADYLESYATTFALPVRGGHRVDRVSREGGGFVVAAGGETFACENVVVAMANYQDPCVPSFACELDEGITQIHSKHYRNPDQLRPGRVLIVGAGNSGAEIARELAVTHPVVLAGRDTGHLPFRMEGRLAHRVLAPMVLRGIFHRVLTLATPMGRKIRHKALSQGGPLIRVKPADLAAAGVERAGRVTCVRDGLPIVDGAPLEVGNVVWCTGFRPDYSWIDLPEFEDGEPDQIRGVAESIGGLYFVGLHFQYALSSTMIHGVDRDAEYVVDHLVRRTSSQPVLGSMR